MKHLTIFVHGWYETDTSIYGELPKRLTQILSPGTQCSRTSPENLTEAGESV